MPRITSEPIFCVITSSTGNTEEIRFNDGSYTYIDEAVNQSFDKITIHNLGAGDIRFSFFEDLDISSATDGSKTLSSGESLSINMTVNYIAVYFVADSQVELILDLDN